MSGCWVMKLEVGSASIGAHIDRESIQQRHCHLHFCLASVSFTSLSFFVFFLSLLHFFLFFLWPWRILCGKPRLIPTRSSIRASTIIGGKVAKATQTHDGHFSRSSITTRHRALGSLLHFPFVTCQHVAQGNATEILHNFCFFYKYYHHFSLVSLWVFLIFY